jgi:hypothetical protein
MSTTPNFPDDTEAQGIPAHADDTTSAYDDPRHPRLDDSPPALPADEPQGVDEYGVTAEEQRHDEPLRARLLREEPDVGEDREAEPLVLDDAPEVLDDEPAGLTDEFGERLSLDEPPVEVGRLIASDGDPYADEEADGESQAVARDSGERLGLSPEEAAMHVVPGERVPYE